MTYFSYISKKKMSSLFSYELSLRGEKCRVIYLGEDKNRYYALFNAETKPKGIGTVKETIDKDGFRCFYQIPNQIKPHF